MEDPVKGPSEVLASQVVVWRKRRNLSVQALADRIAGIGGDLTRVAISRIENGKRSVSLDEWLLLAHGLAVPPVLLFADLESGAHVGLTPHVELHPWLVWQWATGQEPPMVNSPTGGALVTHVEEFGQAQRAIRLYRDEEAASNLVHNARTAIRNAEFVEDKQRLADARVAYVDALKLLAAVFDEMVENGITPPAKHADWVERIRESGMSRYPDRLTIWTPRDENELRPVTAQDVIFMNALDEAKGRGDGKR